MTGFSDAVAGGLRIEIDLCLTPVETAFATRRRRMIPGQGRSIDLWSMFEDFRAYSCLTVGMLSPLQD